MPVGQSNRKKILKPFTCNAIKPGDKPLAHATIKGLTLIPRNTPGNGHWNLRFVSPVTQKRRDMGLGSYPSTTLAKAGELALQARAEIALGLDPIIEREKSEALKNAPSTPTFAEAALKLHANLLPGWKNPKHGQQWINTLKTYVFPHIGELRIDEIKPAHVADALRPIWLSKTETATRVQQRINAVMDWGIAHLYFENNPVAAVDKLLPKLPSKKERTESQPAMNWRKIAGFLEQERALQRYDGNTFALLEFLILTVVRSENARGARWSEIKEMEIEMDESDPIVACVWDIPAERMKGNQRHTVPLSTRAIEILEEQRGQHPTLIFPNPSGEEYSENIFTTFLNRIEAPSTTEGRCATAHGFRSSFRDWSVHKGFMDNVSGRVLAHAVADQVDGAYQRTVLLGPRVHVMQQWSDHVGGKMNKKA